jgi:hypothetical protein
VTRAGGDKLPGGKSARPAVDQGGAAAKGEAPEMVIEEMPQAVPFCMFTYQSRAAQLDVIKDTIYKLSRSYTMKTINA